MPLLSWIRLIDAHQNAVFEMGKNRRRARVTGNRCKARVINVKIMWASNYRNPISQLGQL